MWFFITPKRVLNYILLYLSYLLSRLTGSIFLWGKPIALSVESSGSCQLGCPECPLGSGDNASRKNMKADLFSKIIAECKSHCMFLTLYFQGEAFLNPEIFSFINQAKEAKIYTIVSSNANFKQEKWAENIVKSGLSELIISLDGITEETYQTYRKGGNLSWVLNNLQALSDNLKAYSQSRLKVKIQFLVMSHNEHEIPQVKALAKQLGFKLSLKSIQVKNPNEESELLPQAEKHRRYRKTEKGFVLKNNLKNHCKRLYYNPVITSDGEVRPCCFDKAGEFPMGNINTESFNTIWKSKKYRNFREKVFNQRKNIDICTNCTEGTKNIYV